MFDPSVNLSVNSRKTIADAIIGLLLDFFRQQDICYDHMTSLSRQICFFHSFMKFQLICVRDVVCVESLFVHSRDEVFGHT